MDAALVLHQHVQSLHRLWHKVFTLFLHIKGGFDNMDSSVLLSLLPHKGLSPYLILWIGFFLRDSICRLTFQGSPPIFTPVSVGVPQGSPISPLLFVIYVSSLYTDIPNGLTISYPDDFTITVASRSYRTNIHLFQKACSALERNVTPRNISFAVAKTELIHWRTPRENQTPCRLPVHLEGQAFYPQTSLRWLGILFTLSFDPRAHFSCRLSPAKGAFAAIRRLSPPSIGLPPHLCLTLARSLLAPICLYCSAVWLPSPCIMDTMSVFWRWVCRWTTNCFSTTNSICLYKEACPPPWPAWSATSIPCGALGSSVPPRRSTQLPLVS